MIVFYSDARERRSKGKRIYNMHENPHFPIESSRRALATLCRSTSAPWLGALPVVGLALLLQLEVSDPHAPPRQAVDAWGATVGLGLGLGLGLRVGYALRTARPRRVCVTVVPPPGQAALRLW